MIADIVLYMDTKEHFIIGHFSIFKILLVFGIGYWLIELLPNLADIKLMKKSTFIIYAYHGAPQCWLLGIIIHIFYKMGEIGLILCYLTDVLVVIGVGLLLSMLIHKFSFLTMILTGR